MRPIKFRAWDTKEKEMVEDITIHPEYGWLVMSDNDALTERGRAEEGQFEFMQFTGLTDKNGKEIYEGDILQHKLWKSDANSRYTISNENSFMERYIVKYRPQTPYVGFIIQRDSKVIGNIYENPELLANKEKE